MRMKPGVFGVDEEGGGRLAVNGWGYVINGAWEVEYDEALDAVRVPRVRQRRPGEWIPRAPAGTEVYGYPVAEGYDHRRYDEEDDTPF